MPGSAAPGSTRQRVLVTGGASGIGRAMAEAFIAAGARVHVADLVGEPPVGPATPTLLQSTSSPPRSEATALKRPSTAVSSATSVVVKPAPTGPIEDLDVDDWDRTMAVNLRSMFLVCRRAVPLLREADGGVILNTSSTAGMTGYPMRSPYAASKWAVVGLGATLAMELGEFGIRVNTLCPGSVGGDRMDRVIAAEATATGATSDEIRTGYQNQVSMRTFVEAEDIAAMAVFLASPAARYVSGQTISVDGGLETLRNAWRT